MKRVFLFLAMLLMGVLTFAEETITVSANSEDISQSLDLRVVAKLFAEASTTEQFENMLNNPDSAFSNLDLNGDNQIDYLRVVEAGTANNKLIVIQAVLAKDIYQDVASIYVEKDTKTQEVSVQIIGDEYIYGTNYIIEPVYVYRPIIYNWLWSPRWYCWESPWYWGYYPSWWYYQPCYTYHWYYDRCHRFHYYHHHCCSFRHGHYPHHNYHAVHNNVSRRDYAVSHADNSFNRRHTNVRNANELRQTSVSQRNGGVRQPNFNSASSRTFDSKNTAVQRSGNSQRKQTTTVIQKSSGNSQRTQVSQSQRTQASQSQRTQVSQSQRSTSTNVSTQRSTNKSGASRTTQTHSTNNSNRSTVSTQQRTNNGQVRSSSSSSHRSSGSYSSTPSRSSSSNSTTRSSGSYNGSSRSGGSSKPSRNGNSSSRR